MKSDSPEASGTASEAATLPNLWLVLLLVVLPFGFGYSLSYLTRAVNAVVAPDLVADFGLGPTTLGLMTAAYLFAFAAFQLPLGVLLDRFGPRRVQACLFIVAAVGTAVFAFAQSPWMLIVGRALIGLGFAGGLMSSFKAIVTWAPPERVPLLNGTIMAFGGMGVLVATQPVDMAVQAFGWRAVFLGMTVATLAVVAAILLAVPRGRPPVTGEGLGRQIAAIGRIYQDGEFWRVAPVVATTAGTHVAIQTLWAGPWLADVQGLDRSGVASVLLATALAFAIGAFAGGAAADWLRRFRVPELHVMAVALGIFLLSQAGIVLAFTEIGLLLWIVFGFTGQLGILVYAHLSKHFGAALSGRASTALNLLVFGWAFAAQYLMGQIIELWPELPGGGYHAAAYGAAFGLFLAIQVVAFIWFLAAPRRHRTASGETIR